MRNRLALAIALCVLGALGVSYVAHNDPEEGRALFPSCVFREVTGLHCAGCGGTRAVHALTRFDLGTAFRKNPLLILLLPFLAVGIAVEAVAWVWGEGYRGPRIRMPGRLIWVLPVLIVGFWVFRNIPIWPFDLLAPR